MADLDRSSLSDRLAERLTEDIASGFWTGRLPGYRVLCERYGVSRPTCEAAFGILERQGVLASAEPRRTRRIIAPQPGEHQTLNSHLLVIADRRHFSADDRLHWVDPITTFWKEKGGDTSIVQGDLEHRKRPDSLLGRWIRDAGADCLLLNMPTRFWLRAAKASGLPCYSLGGDRTEVMDWASGSGSSLYQFLGPFLREVYQMGHRRVLIPFSREVGEAAFRDALLSLVNEGLKKDGLDGVMTLSVEAPMLSVASEWHAWWPGIVSRVRPSLVILRDISEAFSFHSFCLNEGIRMPEDISMVVLHDHQFLGWLDPLPTQYQSYPPTKVHRHFQSWTRRGCPPGYWKDFPAELVGGETLGSGPGKS